MREDEVKHLKGCPQCSREVNLTLMNYPMRGGHRNTFSIFECFSCRTLFVSADNFKDNLKDEN